MPHGLVFARSQNVPDGDVLECYNWCNGINETMPYTLNFAYYGVWQEFNECWCGNAQPEVELDLAECAQKSNKASTIFSMQNRRKLPKTHFSLRVVQTQAILFLKSMSERGGSDIERL